MRVVIVTVAFVACLFESVGYAKQPYVAAASGLAGWFREYAVGDASTGPAIVAVDSRDDVWVALAKAGRLARFRNGSIDTLDIGADSRPVGLAAAGDSLWIAASYDNKILRLDLRTAEVRTYPIDAQNSWPFNVAVGPDGGVWFSQRAAGKVGFLDPPTGQFKHYDLPTPGSGPAGLAIDGSSGMVWLTESYADRIASLDPVTGSIREYPMSDKSTGLVSGPAGIAVDATGGVWFAKLEGKLGHLAPGSSEIELVDTPSSARRPAGIAVAADGTIWLAALDGNALVRYSPESRRFSVYALPTGKPDAKASVPPVAQTSRPFGIALDRQGNVWFSEQYTGQLGVLDSAPPSVAITAPEGVVKTATTLLTARVLDRVSGMRQLVWRLDGKEIRATAGRADLADVLPGVHRLQLSATDAAGNRGTAEVEFTYSPGPVAVRELIGRLLPQGRQGAQAKTMLLAAAESLVGEEPDVALTRLRSLAAESTNRFDSAGAHRLATVLAAQGGQLSRTVEMRIVDHPPYFEPDTLTVRRGDSVLWKYDPPSDGHSISHELHRVAVGDVVSNTLRAGESFSHRFKAPGEFAVRNLEKDGAKPFAVVRVMP